MKYPPYLAIEVTNHCFMKCVHCPHGHGLITNRGFIDNELYRDVVGEAALWPEKPEIILYGNGEPLLHKQIVPFVQVCTDYHLKSNLSTNVMLATGDMAIALSNAGLTMIKLSFWGDTKEEYESRTRMQRFDQAIERALEFIENSSKEVKIAITVVKFRGEDTPIRPCDEFLRLFEGYENVQIYSFFGSDWRGTLPVEELRIPLTGEPDHNPCHLAGDMITMAWDGKFALCWLDYRREFDMGHRFEKKGDLMKFWKSETRKKYMDMMYQGRFPDIELCKACSAPYSEKEKPRYYSDSQKSGVCRGTHIFEPEFPTNKVDQGYDHGD